MLGLLAILTPANLVPNSGFDKALAPILVGVLVWAIGLSLGGSTGYAINPARDFGPRLAHALLPIPGKRDADWGYAWIPIAGPVVGGVAGALLFRACGSYVTSRARQGRAPDARRVRHGARRAGHSGRGPADVTGRSSENRSTRNGLLSAIARATGDSPTL